MSGSPVKPGPSDPVDLDAVLLDVSELNSIMGTTDVEEIDEGDAPDESSVVNPPECHAVVNIAGDIEYNPTDFTAMRWRIAWLEGIGSIIQAVTQFPDSSKAEEFVEKQTAAWEACEGAVIASTPKKRGSMTQHRVSSVRTRPNTVIASTRIVSTDRRCQHVLQAASSVVLEVSGCGPGISGQIGRVATELAENVESA